jgi:iron complex outermembrane receptor protein
MIGSYGYTDARVTAPRIRALTGKEAAERRAEHGLALSGLRLRHRLPGRLRLGGGARYVGDRSGDSTNTFVLPSYVVADVFATYETNTRPCR